MLLRKPLLAVTAATVVAAAALSPQAKAADPLLGALIGGGIGAAIGHSANHHNGAAAGAAIGAIVGAGIASSSNYYGDPYYGGGYAPAPAPAYGYGYAPPPAPAYGYYAPPVYAAPSVVIGYSSSYPRHRYYHSGHRHYYRGY
jgi:hypothetical protein